MFAHMKATLFVLFMSAGLLNAAAANQPRADAPGINGSLRVHPQNQRYFTDETGRERLIRPRRLILAPTSTSSRNTITTSFVYGVGNC
jgi:hypothetical protein